MRILLVSIMLSAAVMLMLLDGTYGRKDLWSVNEKCTTDKDCNDGRLCEAGVCYYEGCQTNKDCVSDEICQEGVCYNEVIAECRTNGDCALYHICKEGACYLEGHLG
ncbi:uncharacterized protein LOC120326224 [Styela clava]